MTWPVMDVNALLDADLRPSSGCLVPVPCQQLGRSIMVFPRPDVLRDQQGHPIKVELALTAWLVSIAPGVTLPLVCDSQQTARATGEAFAAHVACGEIDPWVDSQVTGWCRWWATRTDGTEVTDGGQW